MSTTMNLTQMANGREGLVVQVQGGSSLERRLDSMGIRPGAKLKKISGFRSEGPVTIQIGSSQLAIGHGMAEKVLVRTSEGELSMRILLVGNPNVGKSVLFNRLTGANATISTTRERQSNSPRETCSCAGSASLVTRIGKVRA